MSTFESDFYRYYGKNWNWKYFKYILLDHGLFFLFILRTLQTTHNPLIRFLAKLIYFRTVKKYGLEISPKTKIGKGLYLGHAYNITINPGAVIGDNCNIHKGVTIGQENRGKRKGAPVIGSRVRIGVNATIVGRIEIGDDVLIAPNAFVNRDVPSHSIVIGNPCRIIPKQGATEGYINNVVE